jgi:hypothetical protein
MKSVFHNRRSGRSGDDQQRSIPEQRARRSFPGKSLVFAAVGMLALLLILERRTHPSEPAHIARLAESVQRTGRPFHSRLCGFEWTPVRVIVRGPQSDYSFLKARAEIADVLRQTADDPTVSGRRAHAIAEVLTGSTARAIRDFEAAAAGSRRRWRGRGDPQITQMGRR